MHDKERMAFDDLLSGCGIREKYKDEILGRIDEALAMSVAADERDAARRRSCDLELMDRIAGLEGALQTAAKVTRAAAGIVRALNASHWLCTDFTDGAAKLTEAVEAYNEALAEAGMPTEELP